MTGGVREAAGGASALAGELLDRLAARTSDPPGVTRIAYGEGERSALALMAEAARGLGAEIAWDAAGNQFMTLPGRQRESAVLIGSHLDSVPHGGNFDGAAGVVLGLSILETLHRTGRIPEFDVTVACLRAEESCWFPHSYIGSKTALGRLDPAVLDGVRRSDSGRTLADHMRADGFDPDRVRQGWRLVDPDRVLAFIEPHIEQGPVLETEGLPIGIVSSIRGSFRYRDMRCRGVYAHSGATPRLARSDAVVASAELVTRMQSIWEDLEGKGHDLAVTFGIVSTDPDRHSFSKVSGETRLCLDVRSASTETLSLVDDCLKDLVRDIGQRHRVRFELGTRSGSEPARMSPRLVALLQGSAAQLGIACRIMASGAGHDAATFAAAGVPTAMVFIRNANGSHNPDESMEMADFDAALAVVLAAIDSGREAFERLRPKVGSPA